MESKWVLTRDQKKIRFRNLLRKRKMQTAKLQQVKKEVKFPSNDMVGKKERPASLQQRFEALGSHQDTTVVRVPHRSPHFVPTSTATLAGSVHQSKQEEINESYNLPLFTTPTFEDFPPLLDFRARLLQLQHHAEKTGS